MAKDWGYVLEPKHPFDGPYIPDGATHLVIGTFPTHKSRRLFKFYYSGEGNMFWPVIEKVFRHEFKNGLNAKATKERREFLDHYKIGIMDMHEVCYRKGISSKDEHLVNVKLADVDVLLEKYPAITDLIFTSRTDGVGALGLFQIYLMRKGKVSVEIDVDEVDGLKFGDYEKFEIWAPYSPSQSSKKSKTLGVEGLAKMYRKCFKKIAPK